MGLFPTLCYPEGPFPSFGPGTEPLFGGPPGCCPYAVQSSKMPLELVRSEDSGKGQVGAYYSSI